MAVRNWADLTTEEMRRTDFSRAVAVLPVAAIEQHGPHLPLSTDVTIAQGYLARLAALAADASQADAPDVLVLPIQSVGKSDEHDGFPGTLTLTAGTALSAWVEIGRSVQRAGCGRLVIVTSHGGNSGLIDLVASDLRGAGMIAVTTAWSRFGYPDGLFPEAEIRHGIHAGGIETALMLAIAPGAVRREHVADFVPRSVAMARDFSHLGAGRPAAFAWKAQDLNPSGAIGDATLGGAEAGFAALDHGARAVLALLRDVSRFRLDR